MTTERGIMMQVVSRRPNEAIIIGDDIYVTVLHIQDNCVRLGISSSKESPSYWEQTLYCEPVERKHELQIQ